MINSELLALLFAAHLVGDFLLQNDWMQRKSESTFICLTHIAMYSIPFSLLLGLMPKAFPIWMFAAILIEHFLQDRFALHRKWMNFYRQTQPDKWPVGPLCMDQAMHIGFIAAMYLIAIGMRTGT